MSVLYRKIRHVRYLYIKRNVKKVWGGRYTLGARYLSKNTVIFVVCTEALNAPKTGTDTDNTAAGSLNCILMSWRQALLGFLATL